MKFASLIGALFWGLAVTMLALAQASPDATLEALHKAGAGKAVVVAACVSVVVAAHSAPAAIGFVALFLAGVLRERQRTESALGAPAVT